MRCIGEPILGALPDLEVSSDLASDPVRFHHFKSTIHLQLRGLISLEDIRLAFDVRKIIIH